MQAYFETLDHHRRCLSAAQREVCQSVMEAFGSAMSLQGQDLQHHVDDALSASLTLWQVQADTQRDMQRAVEQWLSAVHAFWLTPWQDDDYPFTRALRLSDASCGAIAKMTRQVSHFATVRLSAAAVNAAREARRAWESGQGAAAPAGGYPRKSGCGRAK
ncbi:MAG: hypothetical protein JO171_20425 [Paludibacterium sp.]|uniref:hypothetical protein n=1 Tax=Paludibacterium sp. TaxID=1917523 RepID=UPI0025F24A6D|nr:hypothetical protein [Paludibacterium sp.]MBV8049520.1 hypothetical protein [Paludibacterium sp.]MBV8646219.1 hypothetical protein [Paludibacterium sp.]